MPDGDATDQGLVRRLHRQIRQSDLRIEPFKTTRDELIQAYAGPKYGDIGGRGPDGQPVINDPPLNRVHRFISTLVPLLVAQNPTSDITTHYRPLRPLCFTINPTLDLLLTEWRFVDFMREVLTEALTGGAGFRRIGLGPSGAGPYSEFDAGNGMPFLKHYPLHHMCWDPKARSLHEVWFMGNKFQVSMQYLRESGLYENTEDIRADADGDEATKDSEASKATPDVHFEDPWVDTVTLYDIWLPPGNVIGGNTPVFVTIPSPDRGARPLRISEWHLPRSPYDWMAFNVVPDNPLPLSPGVSMLRLHDLLNELATLMVKQAKRHKKIGVAQRAAKGDAETMRDAEDGEIVLVQDPQAVRELELGGFTEKAREAVEWFQAAANVYEGSTELIAGQSSAPANTATAATYLQQNASVRIRDMRETVYAYTQRILEDAAWMLLTDPDIKVHTMAKVGELELPLVFSQRTVFEAARGMGIPPQEADPRLFWAKLHIRIRPNSMTIKSPQDRVSEALTFMTQIILPLGQYAMAQGKVPNVAGMAEVMQRIMDLPELAEMFVEGPPGTAQLAWNMGAKVLPSQASPAQGGPNQPGPEAMQIQAAQARPGPVESARPVGVM